LSKEVPAATCRRGRARYFSPETGCVIVTTREAFRGPSRPHQSIVIAILRDFITQKNICGACNLFAPLMVKPAY